jgi:hypothetical protein
MWVRVPPSAPFAELVRWTAGFETRLGDPRVSSCRVCQLYQLYSFKAREGRILITSDGSGRMNTRRGCLSGLAFLFVGLLGGVALGVLIGWVVWPVNYVDTDIVDLRAGYQDDYILMVGDAYSLDDNLAEAQRRLSYLVDPNLDHRIVALIQSKMDGEEPPEKIRSLVTLAQGLRVDTLEMVEYVVTHTPTLTPWPTPAPDHTATHTPTATTEAAPSDTPVPAATATATSLPTRAVPGSPLVSEEPLTPVTEATLEVVTPVLTVTVALPPGESASAAGDFVVMSRRMLHKMEVGGCDAPAIIYIKAVDPGGRPVDGVVMRVAWDGGELPPVVTGSKGPGTAETVVWAGDYYVEVTGNVGGEELSSERSSLLRTTYPAVNDLLDAGYCESPSAKECEQRRDDDRRPTT